MFKNLILITFLFTSISLVSEIPSPVEYKEQYFDVISYDVTLRIDYPSTKIVNGESKILVKWQENLPDSAAFYFHARGYNIDSVYYNGKAYNEFLHEAETPSSESYHYYIDKFAGMITDTVTIYYSGTMTKEKGNYDWGGVHYDYSRLYSMGVGFYNNYVSTTQHWMPCFDLPQDKALYKGTFIVPDKFKAISNGKLVEEKDTLDRMKKYTWELDEPAATYLLTFAIGEYREIDIENNENNIPVKAYSYNGDNNESAAKFAFKLVPEMMTAFGESLNYPYPFETLSYYTASKGAMEHQTLITMSHQQVRSVYYGNDSLYSTAAHELAHQWFGNLVSPLDFRHTWLNESFATYFEAVWLEFKEGKEEYYKDLYSKKNSYINQISKQEGLLPLYNYQEFTENNYPATIYYKGAVVLAMIREELGDTFFEILNNYLEDYKNQSITTDSLISKFGDYVSEKFWNDWVYSPGFPKVELELKKESEKFKIYIDQVQEGDIIFNFPVKLEFIYDDGSRDSLEFDVDNESESFAINNSKTVTEYNLINTVYLFDVVSKKISSVENAEILNELNIYPNPVNDEVNIKFPDLKEYSVEFVTIEGKNVLLYKGQYSGLRSFDISDLDTGTYLIIIRQNDSMISQKITVK